MLTSLAAGGVRHALPSLAGLTGLGVIQALRTRAPWFAWALPLLMVAVLFREPRPLISVPEKFLAPASPGLPEGPARIWSERRVVVDQVTDATSMAVERPEFDPFDRVPEFQRMIAAGRD